MCVCTVYVTCVCVCVCVYDLLCDRWRREVVGRLAGVPRRRVRECGRLAAPTIVVPTLDHKSFWMPVKINDKKKKPSVRLE